MWIVALSMIMTKPLGWGPYAFEKYYPEYQSMFTIKHSEIANALNYDIVHSPYNEFLNMAVTIGVVGLVFYLLFIIYILITAYKRESPLFYPLLTYQFVSLSYFPFQIIPLTVIYIMCCAIVVNTDNVSFRIRLIHSSLKPKLLTICMLIPIMMCLSLGLYSFGYWKRAIAQSNNERTYDRACKSFEHSYPYLKGNGRFLISYAELQYRIRNKKMASLLMYQAEHYFSDIAFLHNLAMIYEEDGRINEAKEKFNLAVNMSPNNIDITFAQVQFLQRIGDIEQACFIVKCLRQRIEKNNTILKKRDQFILKEIDACFNNIQK
jgi:tetratricopeptide (TPR) repeat protein